VQQAKSTDSNLGLGVLAGADLPLGAGKWSLHGTLRYVDTSGRDVGKSDLRLDPVMLTFGAARRF